nr:retrotransposon Gag protein [Tanacetum cinerariifolium]
YWYNNNFHTSINTTPFEAVYGQPPTSPILYSPGQIQPVMPQCDPSGSLSCVPVKVLDRKMVKENNKLVVCVLIQWSNGSPDDATWELATALEKKFLDFPFKRTIIIGRGRSVQTVQPKPNNQIQRQQIGRITRSNMFKRPILAWVELTP